MRKNNKKKSCFSFLILLLLCIGLGYAFLTQDLTINGIGKLKPNSWDIHFEDLTLNPNNVVLANDDVAATVDSITRTSITYTVTLNEPGDFYEFEVAVVNSGTLDAMIGTITNKLNGNEISTTNSLPTYLSYTVTYSDGMPIALNQLLEAGNSETIKVRLAFKKDIDSSDLPAGGATNTFSFGLSYIQADNNSITVNHPVSFADDDWATIISAVKSGSTSNYHVGDTKTVELGNSLGTHTIRIANMSTPSECSSQGFSQTACGFVLEFADVIAMHAMNSTETNVGGWPASSMRAYLNDTNEPSSIINSLPDILRNAIIDTVAVSGHSSTVGETNFISTDKLYLLSTHEVWEDIDGDITSGIDYIDSAYHNTRQLDYYFEHRVTNGAYSSSIHEDAGHYSDAIKYYYTSERLWFLRTAEATNVTRFMGVYHIGRWTDPPADSSCGVSPAFRIG